MNNTELLTITISSTALVASFCALYLQFFHKKTAIIGKLLNIKFDLPDNDYERELDYSVSNIGNQEILLNDVKFFESGNSLLGCENDGHTVHKCKCMDSPYVLKPGEIKLFKVSTKIMESNLESKSKKRYFIMFGFASADGKTYEILHDITELNKNMTWKTFTLA